MRKVIKTLEISLVALFFFTLNATPISFAGIPEPGMILYGKVFDESGTLMTAGELTWTFEPTGGGALVIATTTLSEIEGEGGPYSYKVMIPFETAVTGYPVSSNAIPLSTGPVEYTRVAVVTGTAITLNDVVSISYLSRGKVEQVTIGGIPLEDSDEDGLPDAWEQEIIDADPNDDIRTLDDVLADDDFDGDGESNLSEFLNGTDPTDPMSARRGDLDGDKYITPLDAIIALKILCKIDLDVEVSLDGDLNGDGRIGVEEALFVLQKVSGLRE